MLARTLIGCIHVSLLFAIPTTLASPFVNDFGSKDAFGYDKRALLPTCSSSSLLNLRLGSVVGVNLGLGVGLGLTGQPVCLLPMPAGCITSTTSTFPAPPTSTFKSSTATPTSTGASTACSGSGVTTITGILQGLISKISGTVAGLDGKVDPTSALKTIAGALNDVTSQLGASGLHVGQCSSLINTLGGIIMAILTKLNLYGAGGLAGAAANGALGEVDAALKGLLGTAGTTIDGSSSTIATALKGVIGTITSMGLTGTGGLLGGLLK